ncbi:MAG: 3-oxoacyl-[acyl-carrier-protein] synthase III C-terminal domain-containing protein [Candidatus Binatia bacterium]
MPASVVLGCGDHLPERVVGNAELAGDLGTSPEAIGERTGVTRRHYAPVGLGPSDLGREASRAALAAAGLGPEAIDLIVFATMTPDVAFPGSGCYLQDKLGCRTIGALDVRAQDAGFLFALATADRFVRAGKADRVLVVGAEVHSTALERAPRAAAVTPVFGDGAGALLIGSGAAPGVLAVVLHTDPTDLERYWCEFPASRNHPMRMTPEHFHAGRHFYVLDAAAVHPQAERALVETSAEVLAKVDVTPDRLALAVVHYLDPRVARRAAAAAGLPEGRTVAPAETMGHMAAAGIPIALAQAIAAGRVGRGDLVLCLAFGAGMSAAGAVLRL